MNVEEDEIVADKCLTCRRVMNELENLGVKFANCGTCKDAIMLPVV